jgi:hypothetical protein
VGIFPLPPRKCQSDSYIKSVGMDPLNPAQLTPPYLASGACSFAGLFLKRPDGDALPFAHPSELTAVDDCVLF